MFRRMFNHAKRLSLAAWEWAKGDRFKAARLVVLLLILSLAACQSETYKKAYAEAIEKGRDESAAKTYARKYIDAVNKALAEGWDNTFIDAYAEAVAEGKGESAAKTYARNYMEAYEYIRKVRKNNSLDKMKNHRYARAFARFYAETYTEATAEGKDHSAAQAYALFYALERTGGRDHISAKAYVEAYQDARKVKGMDDAAAKTYAETAARKASQQ